MSRSPSGKNGARRPSQYRDVEAVEAHDRYDEHESEKPRREPNFRHNDGRSGGKPGRENEPLPEEPGENTPTPTEPPDYRDEPPPEEKADRPRYGMEDGSIYDEEIDHGDYLRRLEDLGRNHQKARHLSQDDVEEWQNSGTPAHGRSSRAFEEEIRYHAYRDENHDHPHWYHDTRSRDR